MDTATLKKLQAANSANAAQYSEAMDYFYQPKLLGHRKNPHINVHFIVNKCERKKTTWDFDKTEKTEPLIRFTPLGRKLFGAEGFPE